MRAHPATEPRRRGSRRARKLVSRAQHGMTLVEVMVAMSVIAVIMSGLALSIGVDYKAVALARSRQVAESAANKRLEELRDVDYASLALDTQPVHSTDPTNPDYYVSTNGATYDVTGSGQNETLIVDTDGGPVRHIESPVTVGTTVVDVYQYVTWVDDPGIPGTQNLKRITVVVQYHNVPTIGQSKFLRESVILTPGNVTLPASAVTTTSTTSTSSTSSTTSTTAASGACGSFSVAGSSGATVGYTASTTVTITLALTGCGSSLLANFSNDGGATWGSDFSYSSTATTLAWTLTSGDGTKTISARVRSGSAGTPWNLASKSIILDTTKPSTPASFSRTLSCSGSTRTVVLQWTAASDTYLVGYHVYISTDGTTWSLLASTSGLTATTTNSKTLTSVRYYVKAYDSAGNESNATSIISLAKNQCS
ncbi:MAG: prepilin-type N-terminal cleavage/methylation domain-containing protein [Acidimicrobiia bacterium]